MPDSRGRPTVCGVHGRPAGPAGVAHHRLRPHALEAEPGTRGQPSRVPNVRNNLFFLNSADINDIDVTLSMNSVVG